MTSRDTSQHGGEASSSPQALTVRALDGQAWTEATPDILDAGVDTVEFSFDVEVSQAMWDALENERQIAEELMKERRAVHVPEWLNAQISPTGAQGGYRFLLETPHFAVKLLHGVPNRPPIYVEMRAFGLHTHPDGALAACEEACAFIRDMLLADQDQAWAERAVNVDAARCSRLDPYIDWQGGWMPTFESGDERCFVKRVHASADRFSCDGAVTDRKSTRLNSSHPSISYAVFCLKKKKKKTNETTS